MERARRIGFRWVRLDTAPELEDAIRLYGLLGFREIPRYRDDLYEDARCFEVDVDSDICG